MIFLDLSQHLAAQMVYALARQGSQAKNAQAATLIITTGIAVPKSLHVGKIMEIVMLMNIVWRV